MIRLSESFKVGLLHGKEIPSLKNKKGKTYLRYNRISFDSLTGRTSFYYNGDQVFYFDAKNFTLGDTVTVDGVTGRSELKVTE